MPSWLTTAVLIRLLVRRGSRQIRDSQRTYRRCSRHAPRKNRRRRAPGPHCGHLEYLRDSTDGDFAISRGWALKYGSKSPNPSTAKSPAMHYQFTPAAQRALRTAAGWTSRKGLDELETSALLLGLLAETECRAAIMLADRGVDAAAVRRRWPELMPRETPPGSTSPASGHLSADVERSLRVACERLAD
jgi:hypothetical protein